MTHITQHRTTFLVFYKFRALTHDEKEKSRKEWNELKNTLPQGIELIGEYSHAWGTEYNGFLLFQAETSDSFFDWWSEYKDSIRWYVDKTHTIVARRK
ncbi:MAG: hypothetical protein MRJ93_13705 [Nitrososphaeraceae archaeon]|nr:hypothetical protein [Nitrososphaeraceae archaeon]